MSRPTLEVADIFRAQADNFIDKHNLSIQQLKVIRAITRCRTAALGGHVDVCPQCGGDPAISYNSCRNRHCNKWSDSIASPVDRCPEAGTASNTLLPRRLYVAP
jgi:hypothetical protein